tara:strand:- start:280 stop:441 length:162 start_codon:yes stop_codon:yes gene_type:complete
VYETAYHGYLKKPKNGGRMVIRFLKYYYADFSIFLAHGFSNMISKIKHWLQYK